MSDNVELERWEKNTKWNLIKQKKIEQNQIKTVLMYFKEEDVVRIFLVSLGR